MVKFTDLVLVICAVLLVLLVASAIAQYSQVPMIKNLTYEAKGNWSYYDGKNTLIHCDCGSDGYRDMIFYGNRTPDTEGWCKMILVSERTTT